MKDMQPCEAQAPLREELAFRRDDATRAFPVWRARGCLLGLATGDALGAPLEFSDERTASVAASTGLEMRGGRGWDPGEWTDDTTMALLLADSIVARGLPLDTDDLLRRYGAWANSSPKDIGILTGKVLRSAQDGADARRRARKEHEASGMTAGNGTVMRAAPIALAATSSEQALTAAREDAVLTHFDPLAGAASAALCAALLAIAADEDPVNAAAAEVAEHRQLMEVVAAVRSGIPQFLVALAPSRLLGVCWTTLSVALYALTHFDSYEEGVIWVIGLGGDTDTNAAVAGALLGCRGGEESIPERWRTALLERQRITRVAEELVARTSQAPGV